MHRMPTQNPRLTVTFTPATDAVIRELSALTGQSRGSLVAELVDQAQPVLERMVRLLRAATEARQRVASDATAHLHAVQTDIERAFGLALDELDRTLPLFDEGGAVRRRGVRTPAAGAGAALAAAPDAAAGVRTPRRSGATPLSNRGVRSRGSTTKAIAQRPAKAKAEGQKLGQESASGQGG